MGSTLRDTMHSLVSDVEPMVKSKHLYTFTYDKYEAELANLECKLIFGLVGKDKLLWSDKTIDPSTSAFVKQRIDVFAMHTNYALLLAEIKTSKLCVEGFKVEYLVLDGDQTAYDGRLDKLKDIGYCIEGNPDYYHPSITYTLCKFEENWIFGILIKDKFDWYKHKNKPRSYSNSIGPNIAKALVNIASKAYKKTSLLDACCGVGTIMLEACFAGYTIEGTDINWKICKNARENLAYFEYDATVYRSDIKDLEKRYDAAIVDLPYNLLSQATEETTLHIIRSTSALTHRLVIVSTTDISELIHQAGLFLIDSCRVGKRGKTVFERRVWVCERRVD